MASFSNFVSDRKFRLVRSQSYPSRNMPGPPAPWHAAPMALSAAIRVASSRLNRSRAISRSVVTFCCESCSGAIRNTGTWTNLPSLATVTVRPPPPAAPPTDSGWSLFSFWRTLTATSPGPAAPGVAPVVARPVACTSAHASSRASSASRVTGISSAPSSTSLAAKRAPRYLPNKRAGRYRWGPSVVVVVASAPLTAPLTAPMGHGRTLICAGMPRWDCVNASGSMGSLLSARENTFPLGAPARREGMKTSSITRWSAPSSLTVQMNTAVLVDLTSFSKMNAPSSPMPIRPLSKASLVIVSRATKTKPPSKSGISPAGGGRHRAAAAAPPMLPSPLPGLGPRSLRPRPPRPLASRPRPRPRPPSRGRFWPEGAMGGGAPPPSLTLGGDRSGWRTQLAMIASG